MTHFRLDPRLEADTLPVVDLGLSTLRLARDANYPWLILVPRRIDVVEILDLDDADRAHLYGEIDRVAAVLKAETAAHKLNIAALGNVVSQLHVHVIARFVGDPAWPAPVWGKVPAVDRSAAASDALIARLQARLA